MLFAIVTSHLVVPTCATLLLIAANWIYMKVPSRRSEDMIRAWTQQHSLVILSMEQRFWNAGPFILHRLRGQTVYRIVVRDPAGDERAGFVRCGGFLNGLLVDELKVAWDAQA